MYETIYIEKNKKSRFGVYFYDNSSDWNVFLDVCGIQNKQIAVICNDDITNEAWKVFAQNADAENVLKLSDDTLENDRRIRSFLDEKKQDYTIVILCDSCVMDVINRNVTADDWKMTFISVPVTPFAMFDGITIRPKLDGCGEIVRKELLPEAVYIDISVLKEATPVGFLDGIASAFRLAISHKASMFQWMISNMYELTDGEEEAVVELLQRGYGVLKERIEKDTAKERALEVYGTRFYNLLSMADKELSMADLASLSMVCQTYLSWKKDLISMDEYYEIRDMFVFFGMSITETSVTVDEMINLINNEIFDTNEADEWVYIRKVGKLVKDTAPTKELFKEALEQIYFDENALD